ncbi:MAG: hypothetical protein VKQ33_03860 [Candidatus Sericytochromatia bacterium]|nr:hypothetical protein [Candidatus Sericytochromatia bacterium]
MEPADLPALLDPRLAAWLAERDDALLAAFCGGGGHGTEAASLAAGLLDVVEAGPAYRGERERELAVERGLLELAARLAALVGDASLEARAALAGARRAQTGSPERLAATRRAWEAACSVPAGAHEDLAAEAVAEALTHGDVAWLCAIAGRGAAGGRGGWLWRTLRAWLVGAVGGAAVLAAWLEAARGAGDRAGLAWACLAAAEVRLTEGHPAQALTRLDEAVALFAEDGDDEGLARALGLRLRTCLEQQDDEGAEVAAEGLARLAVTTRCPRAREVLACPFSA